ncbi:MAG: hypothetical protein KTR16_11485 [Acidiferrobacterales bacterium]|nr:hypothetical protein [Acidiferrobacterales bacterium]
MHQPSEITTQEILASVNIVDLFREHAELRKQGKEYVCLCPIHNEKSPSCHVHEDKQLFHCKGCNAGGSAVDFLAAVHQVDIGEAFRMIKERIGFAPEQQREAAPVRLTEKGEAAKMLRDNAEIEKPYFFDEYGLVAPIHYVYRCQAVVTLSAYGKPTDFIKENDFRSGKLTDEGICVLGQHSQKLCLVSDYIDAVYLRQKLDKSIMIVFCGHPARLVWAVEYCKKQYGNDIAVATPNIWDHVKFTECLDVPVMIPPTEGYWCEKSMRQEVL